MLDPQPDTPSVSTKGRILVIDDEADIRESLEVLLTMEGYEVELAVNATDGLGKMERGAYDLVLLDLMMPDRLGLEVLDEARQRDHETPIFLITAYGSTQVAVNALKSGANDYFSKPWDNEKLLLEIGRMIGAHRLERENVQLKRALKQRYGFENIIGKSERMMKVLDLVAQVAPSRSTVMITGETGTGKELIAKAIHSHSPRAGQVFIPVNTGALTPELLESTLFGHVKGAFTSAISARKGYFEEANRGTIFFDEISTISADTQVKLLRVIQERQFMPLGSSEIIHVDVRLIAAANVDLKKLVEEGKFREDLYYRLNVIPIHMPALRDRKEDIPLLVAHFFDKYGLENDKFTSADLAPKIDAPERGRYLSLMVYSTAQIEPSMGDAIFKVETAPGRGWSDFETVKDLVEGELGDGPYLFGEWFTAADVMVGSMFIWQRMIGIPTSRPNLDAYVDRLLARPKAMKFGKD